MGCAARLFCGSADQTLIDRITPTPEQRSFLQEQWNRLADHLRPKLLAKHGLPISTWLQGSYKYGTLIRPVHPLEEYDVDVGVYFEWPSSSAASPTPRQLRDWVQRELMAYEQTCTDLQRVEDPARERCSRAIYAGQFHIDLPTYHLDRAGDIRRLACLSDKWEASDPKAIYLWFREAVAEEDREQLRRLVRYLKAWAALAFDKAPEGRPSSILLTVLVAQSFQKIRKRQTGAVADDDALSGIIDEACSVLQGNRRVRNPIDQSEDLSRFTDDGWRAFMEKLTALKAASDKAREAEDEPAAALAWAEVFSFLMPLPEADAVEIVEKASGTAVMQIPDVTIDVYARDPKRLIATHVNEVPQVMKQCDLEFRISNPAIIPRFATIEWTVRNVGQEAEARTDLGHRKAGMSELQTKEETRYSGGHFMDCVIWLNGRVYAVRRIPVTVSNVSRPPRNPPRLGSLRSFFSRR